MTNKLEAPERIWVEVAIIGAEDGSHGSTAWATHDPDAPDIEYTRADITAELLEALEAIVVDDSWGLEHDVYMKCRAAIAKAKGETT